MSNDNAGRTSRTTSGNGPVGSTVAIVVTAIALILGFLILRKMNDDGAASVGGASTNSSLPTSSSVDPAATSSTVAAPTTTEAPLVKTGTNVQVANCSTQNQVAGALTTALSGVGFTTETATNCSPTQAKQGTTTIVYDPDDPNAQVVAESLGRVLGGIVPTPQSNPVPNEAGAYSAGTGVLVLLGDDLAGKTLDQIAGTPTTGTTVAPVADSSTSSSVAA